MSGTNKKLILIGAGGHSKVVADVARSVGYDVIGHLDDNPPATFRGKYLGTIREAAAHMGRDVEFFIALGNNQVRRKVASEVNLLKVIWAKLVDPSAIVGTGVNVGGGSILMPGVIVNADTKIGEHAILNTAATVDHDCVIGDFAHISPGAHLAGTVEVGDLTQIGIGASIIQFVKVGANSIVGAGAAVVRDVPDRSVAVGVPAKVMKQNHS